MNHNYHFVLIGGDQRYLYLASLLMKNHFSASTYGLEGSQLPKTKKEPDTQVLSIPKNHIPVILFPIPLEYPKGFLNNPFGKSPIPLTTLTSLLPENALVFGGKLPFSVENIHKNITYHNLTSLPSFQKNNAIATAAGSIMEAIKNSPFNMFQSHCVVLGFGYCGKEITKKLRGMGAEPFGPKEVMDIMLILPCTGNTLAKLSNGIFDTPVLMAVKAHLRNGRPLVISLSTNDGLGLNLRNMGILLNTKNIYFVPLGQDDPIKKPNSLVAHLEDIEATIEAAFKHKQIQPILK